jgi:hypothetical protein
MGVLVKLVDFTQDFASIARDIELLLVSLEHLLVSAYVFRVRCVYIG